MNTVDTAEEVEIIEFTWTPPPVDEDEIPTIILEWYPTAAARRDAAQKSPSLPR